MLCARPELNGAALIVSKLALPNLDALSRIFISRGTTSGGGIHLGELVIRIGHVLLKDRLDFIELELGLEVL